MLYLEYLSNHAQTSVYKCLLYLEYLSNHAQTSAYVLILTMYEYDTCMNNQMQQTTSLQTEEQKTGEAWERG